MSWGENAIRDLLPSATEGDDILYGDFNIVTGFNDNINALAGNDVVKSGKGHDKLIGSSGNDQLWGYQGNDEYYFEPGWGQDVIVNYDYTKNSVDVIRFGEGISPADIRAERSGTSSLLLKHTNGTDSVRISSYYAREAFQIDEVHFAGGVIWTKEDIEFLADSGVLHKPPEIVSDPISEGHVSETYFYQLSVNAQENSQLNFQLAEAPQGMQISTTGLVLWQSPSAGVHVIRIQVTDDQNMSAEQVFQLLISSEPRIISQPATLTFLNTLYRYTPLLAGNEATSHVFSLNQAPPGMTIDAATGELQWLADTAGVFTIELQVENAAGETESQTFTLEVILETDLRIVSSPLQEAYAGLEYRYQVSVLEISQAGLEYNVSGADSMTISDTGLISWVADTPGIYNIEIAVSSADGMMANQSFQLNVLSLEETDAMFNQQWSGLFTSAAPENTAAMSAHLSAQSQLKYLPVFEALGEDLDEILENYSELVRVSITADVAIYATRRLENGDPAVFMVMFIRDNEGEWKIHQM